MYTQIIRKTIGTLFLSGLICLSGCAWGDKPKEDVAQWPQNPFENVQTDSGAKMENPFGADVLMLKDGAVTSYVDFNLYKVGDDYQVIKKQAGWNDPYGDTQAIITAKATDLESITESQPVTSNNPDFVFKLKTLSSLFSGQNWSEISSKYADENAGNLLYLTLESRDGSMVFMFIDTDAYLSNGSICMQEKQDVCNRFANLRTEHAFCKGCEEPLNPYAAYQLMRCKWVSDDAYCINDIEKGKKYWIVNEQDCENANETDGGWCKNEVDTNDLAFATKGNYLYQRMNDEEGIDVGFEWKALLAQKEALQGMGDVIGERFSGIRKKTQDISDSSVSRNSTASATSGTPCDFAYDEVIYDQHGRFKELFRINEEKISNLIKNYECSITTPAPPSGNKNDCLNNSECLQKTVDRLEYFNCGDDYYINAANNIYDYQSVNHFGWGYSPNFFAYKEWNTEHICFIDHDGNNGRGSIRHVGPEELRSSEIDCSKKCIERGNGATRVFTQENTGSSENFGSYKDFLSYIATESYKGNEKGDYYMPMLKPSKINGTKFKAFIPYGFGSVEHGIILDNYSHAVVGWLSSTITNAVQPLSARAHGLTQSKSDNPSGWALDGSEAKDTMVGLHSTVSPPVWGGWYYFEVSTSKTNMGAFSTSYMPIGYGQVDKEKLMAWLKYIDMDGAYPKEYFCE